jgi:hypothetical protein
MRRSHCEINALSLPLEGERLSPGEPKGKHQTSMILRLKTEKEK